MRRYNLGMASALVMTIFSAVISLSKAGYSYYDSLQQARKQQREQRYLEEWEMSQLAELLVAENPSISFSDWLDYVKATNLIYPPDDVIPVDTFDWKKYAPYAVIGVLLISVVKKWK